MPKKSQSKGTLKAEQAGRETPVRLDRAKFNGRSPGDKTLWRWRFEGRDHQKDWAKTVYLEWFLIGRNVYTTEEAVERWLNTAIVPAIFRKKP